MLTVSSLCGDADSIFILWWCWQYLHSVVMLTVSSFCGDADSVFILWWCWQCLHFCGDTDTIFVLWWYWQCLQSVVTLILSSFCGDTDSIFILWTYVHWTWNYLFSDSWYFKHIWFIWHLLVTFFICLPVYLSVLKSVSSSLYCKYFLIISLS